MAICAVQPHPEMYGLGIRIAFYLQWLGTLWFNYVDQTALPDLRLLGSCLSGSMTLALLMESLDTGLGAAEMCVMTVLATGAHMFLVPVYIWRLISGCRCYWDPSYWTEEEPLRIYRVVNFVTVVAGTCVAVWFFAGYLPGLEDGCQQYGFMFGELSMKNWGFIVLNSMLHAAVLAVCVVIMVAKLGTKVKRGSIRRRRRRRRENYNHIRRLATIQVFSDCVVWVMLVATVELAITYNNLSGANSVSSVAQLFELLASIGACLRAHWLHAVDNGAKVHQKDHLAQNYSWPMTYEDWWALAEYQQALDIAREHERWSRHWRRQIRRAYRGWSY